METAERARLRVSLTGAYSTVGVSGEAPCSGPVTDRRLAYGSHGTLGDDPFVGGAADRSETLEVGVVVEHDEVRP